MKTKISITIDEDTVNKIYDLAQTEKRSLSQMLNILCEEGIEGRTLTEPEPERY